jgi:hypothetical protein
MSDSIIRFVTDDELEIQVDWGDLINVPTSVTNLEICGDVCEISGQVEINVDEIASLKSQVSQLFTNQSNYVSYNIFNKHHHDCRYFTRNQLKMPTLGGEVHWKNLVDLGNLTDAINDIETDDDASKNIAEALSASYAILDFLDEASRQSIIDSGLTLDQVLPSISNPYVTYSFITNDLINSGFSKEGHTHYLFQDLITTETEYKGLGRISDQFGDGINGPHDWSFIFGHAEHLVHRSNPDSNAGLPSAELNWVDEEVAGKKVWTGSKHIFTAGGTILTEDDDGGSKDIANESVANLDLENESVKIYEGLYVGNNLNTKGESVNFRQAQYITMQNDTSDPTNKNAGFMIERETGDLEVFIDNWGSTGDGDIYIATRKERGLVLGKSGQDDDSIWRRLTIQYDYEGTSATNAAVEIEGSVGIGKKLWVTDDVNAGAAFNLTGNLTVNGLTYLNGDIFIANADISMIDGDFTTDGSITCASDAGKFLRTGASDTTDAGSVMFRNWTALSSEISYFHPWVRDFSTSSNMLTLRSSTAEMSASGRFGSLYNDGVVASNVFGPQSTMDTTASTDNIAIESGGIYEDDFAYSGLRINSGLEELDPDYHTYQYMAFSHADHLNGAKLSAYAPSGSEVFGWVMSDWFRTTGEITADDKLPLHLVASKEYVDFVIDEFVPSDLADLDNRYLDVLENVSISGAVDGHILIYDSTLLGDPCDPCNPLNTGGWVNKSLAEALEDAALGDLSDVDTSGVSDGDVIIYNSGTQTWTASNPYDSDTIRDQISSIVEDIFDWDVHTEYDNGATNPLPLSDKKRVYVGCNPSSTNVFVTLPSTPSEGDTWIIKDESGVAGSSGNVITVYSGGGYNIDNAEEYQIDEAFGSIMIVFVGSVTYGADTRNRWSIVK